MSVDFLNNPIDISKDFQQLEGEYFLPSAVTQFDPDKASGSLKWNYHRWVLDWFFNKIDKHLQKQESKIAPFQDYESHPVCEFSFSFISPRTCRLRMHTSNVPQPEIPSLMLDGVPAANDSWKVDDSIDKTVYKSPAGTLILNKDPWQIQLYNDEGSILLNTQINNELQGMHSKGVPFMFTKNSADYSKSIVASFSLFPGEKIFGCGESFTRLNKTGQKLVLFTTDAQSTASQQMYKPIPFFFSDRGYGMFIHTSAPVTLDFGYTHGGCQSIFIGENTLDIFFFIGSPKQILYEYTNLTGRSPLPPRWSFGLWMSRFSYRSGDEVKSVAENLRKRQVPCDVIHIDAGWFEKGINCDFKFNKTQFPDPQKLMRDLKQIGFRTSLWQIPYFTPLNPIFNEVVNRKLFVHDGNGNIATEDAILDFSNKKTIEWYQRKLLPLLQLGIDVIKADFGESGPFKGTYASGRTGLHEHNLYPLRYNKIVAELTRATTNENIIWARSAWAGSQRFPVHWSGDSEVSDAGMAGALKGGLSLGLSGFSFWSHDIGGFSGSPNEELFKRWAFFGLLSSHSRVHGFPPREPWEFSENFQTAFRKIVELKYQLMPYVYSQAALCSQQGLPMIKALLLNFPDDPAAWLIDDQYLFGDDILVAPIMEANNNSRKVYLPAGQWIDFQSREKYEGNKWYSIHTLDLPGIIFIRYGSLIPTVPVAQSTAYIDWTKIELIAFSDEEASCDYYFEETKDIRKLNAIFKNNSWQTEPGFEAKFLTFTIKDYRR